MNSAALNGPRPFVPSSGDVRSRIHGVRIIPPVVHNNVQLCTCGLAGRRSKLHGPYHADVRKDGRRFIISVGPSAGIAFNIPAGADFDRLSPLTGGPANVAWVGGGEGTRTYVCVYFFSVFRCTSSRLSLSHSLSNDIQMNPRPADDDEGPVLRSPFGRHQSSSSKSFPSPTLSPLTPVEFIRVLRVRESIDVGKTHRHRRRGHAPETSNPFVSRPTKSQTVAGILFFFFLGEVEGRGWCEYSDSVFGCKKKNDNAFRL